MLSNRIAQLAPPPRPVPVRVTCRTLLGITGAIGAIFFVIGMGVSFAFVGGIKPVDEIRLATAAATAQGTITRIAGTNASINESQVMEIHFVFDTPKEKGVTGVSFATGWWSVEEQVTVEYAPNNPAIARIEGTSLSTFPWWVGLLTLMFPLTGAGLLAASVVTGVRQVRLLEHGEISGAQIISQRPTSVSVNNVPVFEYTYEFPTPDGESYIGSSKSLPSGRIGDEAQEPVLYLPWNPRRSVLVDALPLRYPLDVGSLGEWVTAESVWPIVWCAIIGIVALGSVAYVVLQSLGAW